MPLDVHGPDELIVAMVNSFPVLTPPKPIPLWENFTFRYVRFFHDRALRDLIAMLAIGRR